MAHSPPSPEVHTTVTAQELAETFEQEIPVDLSSYGVEDWLTLIAFWVMAGLVFLQFFTRYVLNDSLAWTEEVASYALVVVVFLGASMCVRLSGTSRWTCSTVSCRGRSVAPCRCWWMYCAPCSSPMASG